jgi:hypothetical protein
VGEPEVRRTLGRQRCRWTDNTKTYLEEIGWGGMDWIGLAQDGEQFRALVNVVKSLWVP